MTDEAEVTILLYQGLLAEEEAALKGLENDVVRVLLENAVTSRAVWMSRTDDNVRSVQLCVPVTPPHTVVLQLPSSEVATLSQSALLSRLRDSLIERSGT